MAFRGKSFTPSNPQQQQQLAAASCSSSVGIHKDGGNFCRSARSSWFNSHRTDATFYLSHSTTLCSTRITASHHPISIKTNTTSSILIFQIQLPGAYARGQHWTGPNVWSFNLATHGKWDRNFTAQPLTWTHVARALYVYCTFDISSNETCIFGRLLQILLEHIKECATFTGIRPWSH